VGAQFCSRLAIALGKQNCHAIAGKWDQPAVLIIATEVVEIEWIASIPAVVSVAEPISKSAPVTIVAASKSKSAPVAIVAASISIAAKSSTAECSAAEPTSAEPPTVETASAKTASMETSTAKTASVATATATATASERYRRLDQDDCRKYEQGFIQFPHDASSIGTISFPMERHFSLRNYFRNRRTFAVN
jgi:hypothetical protein